MPPLSGSKILTVTEKGGKSHKSKYFKNALAGAAGAWIYSGRVLAALAKDLDWVPNTYMTLHNYLTPVPGYPTTSSEHHHPSWLKRFAYGTARVMQVHIR